VAAITVRGINDETKARLRVRAAEHGRSMEAEVRAIIDEALTERRPATGLGSRIHRRFDALGGDVLSVPDRDDVARNADLG